jgi:ABC-type dipeptide/oligopeptide/nickel transport system ATPase subunit
MPISSPQVMLDLSDVKLELRSAAGMVNILNGITLQVEAAERVGLVGPSGSGKSSLMMLMGGWSARPADKSASLGTTCRPWTRTGWLAFGGIMSASSSRISISCRR